LDPRTLSTIYLHEFENNEHAVSVTFLNFAGYEEQYLCIGTVKDLVNEPTRKFAEGFIHTFTITPNGKELTLLHSTNIDEIPYALSAWRGRLLVGAGSHLRAYEMGKKRLLKKAELKNLNSFITNIHVHHDRIFVTELSDSVHLLRYRIKDQTFMELADDILPRWVTASCLVDYHTVVAADKFENIFITRVPLDIDEE
jgi:splicing factor 3B subunit 3